MNRTVACLLLAGAYVVARPYTSTLVGRVSVTAAPIPGIAVVAGRMTRSDREDMSKAYTVFARAVEADPVDDPVFPDTAALRRSHRAMLLCVWRGLMNNNPGQVPGLKEAVEGAFDQRIGSDEVLLNPDLKQSAAKALHDIAASFK